jgi:poly(beta-D-mannuronate) lyase
MLSGVGHAYADDYHVADKAAYWAAVKALKPGDRVILANGVWRDFEIVFSAKGEEGAPVSLAAETPGKVIISGQSNLRLGGEFLEVSGLVFKDGYTPTSEVISFRVDADNLANNSRVTEVVIDTYNPPERHEPDSWVMLYGKNNRFDQNHLAGKQNAGVTVAVRLNSEQSQQNHHRIDHNYFGPRQVLGSNGGETLRIGTSHYSLTDSFTTVENNYFDRCDGEVEIISNKSGKNTFRNNTFYKSRGTLTLRHGNDNFVERNVFLGGDVDHTGGIRIINTGQTVRENYLEGLKGTRFGGALVVMNGVPNSPINRYHQVRDAKIVNNSLINSDNIQLAAGSDAERSAVPIDSDFSRNLITHQRAADIFTVYDDVSGVSFAENLLVNVEAPQIPDGFSRAALSLARADNGLLYPNSAVDAGAPRDLDVTTKEETGVAWYAKPESDVAFDSGGTIKVTPTGNALADAVARAKAGDTLVLQPGDYTISKLLRIAAPLTIRGKGKVTIKFERSALFEIVDGGSLKLSNIDISGEEAPDRAGNSVIRTSPYSMLRNYRLEILDVNFRDMDVNHSFDVISAAKGTFADSILIKDSSFQDVTGAVLKLDKEADDYGIYNAEYVTIAGSTFGNVQGAIVDLYRGGTDESTFGPHFALTTTTLINVGGGKRNKSSASVHLHGVQVANIAGNTFKDSGPIRINHTVGQPQSRVAGNAFINTPPPEVAELNSGAAPTAVIEDNKVKSR